MCYVKYNKFKKNALKWNYKDYPVEAVNSANAADTPW